jgi:CHAD domain-containing protein
MSADGDATRAKMQAPTVVALGLKASFTRFAAELRAFQHKADKAESHDLRVGIRRLLAALDLVAALDEDLLPARLGRDLKRVLDALSPLRDLEIQRQALVGQELGDSARRELEKHLGRREHKVRRALRRRVEDFPLRRSEQAVGQACAELELSAGERTQSARLAVVGAVARRYWAFDRRRRAAGEAGMKELHRVRVAFKKYRYAVELGAPLLKPVSPQARAAMKLFQDQLGALQDAGVVLGLLARGRATRALVDALTQQQRELAAAVRETLAVHTAARVPEFSQPLR